MYAHQDWRYAGVRSQAHIGIAFQPDMESFDFKHHNMLSAEV